MSEPQGGELEARITAVLAGHGYDASAVGELAEAIRHHESALIFWDARDAPGPRAVAAIVAARQWPTATANGTLRELTAAGRDHAERVALAAATTERDAGELPARARSPHRNAG